ncbi:VCBS repeat-containing protein [Adhaeribacter swui]|uniref:VCBS repeat-containing protein n=1 Tax=Adhaeribacter swui TaxID=2086471 RepID=A0A7G7G2N5_9BACT|nr:VCBS repeat-containing protein [Adhaeribacter swui]QNF31419.1 VCBS repeat-containing protein [Adhaeribacter swui]
MVLIYLFWNVIASLLVFFPPTPRFEAQTIDPAISIGYGLAIGDVDGDRKPDILLADQKQFVWYRNGDWKRFVLAENLTERDNVCIAAQDLDGDGKVEIAVGAQWNPGETQDTIQSGAVFYLIRPKNPTEKWEAVRLPHEPTVHRMRWVKSKDGGSYLVVVPLHGRGNKAGEGVGVKIKAYQLPANPRGSWPIFTLDQAMHLTHNLDVIPNSKTKQTDIYLAGKEGVRFLSDFKGKLSADKAQEIAGVNLPTGEVRLGNGKNNQKFLATIEPMHGTAVAVYALGQNATRQVLDENIKEGHALATADVLGLGQDQVIAGWRNPNNENKVGIKLYVPAGTTNMPWQSFWIDENTMATEDLQVQDLNADGKPDIIAAGRATKNLKIYWNKSK